MGSSTYWSGYWQRGRIDRRAMLRGGAAGTAVLAAAAALGCGGDSKQGAAKSSSTGAPGAAQGQATPNPEAHDVRSTLA